MDKINKMMMDSFKNIFEIILKEAETKVQASGIDPVSKRGKALVSVIYKKVLSKLGIDLEQYTTEEFKLFWEKNKAELMSELSLKIDNALSRDNKKQQELENKIEEIGIRSIKWEKIKNIPPDLFTKITEDTKARGDIALLFKNVMSVRENLTNYINTKIASLKIWHKDLQGVGPDDHHKEKHTLESHLDSKLLNEIKNLINNPPVAKYFRGGGDTVKAGSGVTITENADGTKIISTGTTTNIVDDETPTGDIDGANQIYTLAHTPITGSLKLYVNGQRMTAGGVDYTLTGNSISMVTAPMTGSILLADYRF
ncbi:MAG: hypothetical protein NT155_03760 [Candidatus Staskawiczbacteria bacterium]|nr:hypothetical protein [Candidatus Staskawiczbacteria bacterium]